ncbi:PAS domain-containing sensor histidine kinase [Geobacter pickeringii]|uniref:Histidine kinase n=1 Tax=Geobacter pickeringii TaxID=345632 RepID=A0A0B5BGL7_9BACT|nr:PAS domain-containing sensor histidine kinase [Geobacter pickeringii]AJE03660.1 histidine kinase [Geobacter pickeringii]
MGTFNNLHSASYLAPTPRASSEEVRSTRRRVLRDAALRSLLEALPDYVLILNHERQVVAANSRLLSAFDLEDIEKIIGKRPGEVLGCIFSSRGPAGCGTSPNCQACGAFISILESQQLREQNCQECRITLNREGSRVSLDLEVISNPAQVDGLPLTVCIIRDISDQKRRNVLERVFFHDVINTAGGIHGIASMLAQSDGLPRDKELQYKEWMVQLSNRLIDEINHQRKLLAAERGEFKPDPGMVDVPELLREVHALYVNHDIADGRMLIIGPTSDCLLVSDAAILRRILGNLVKNALEASARGETVTLAGADHGETVTFTVHNPGVMSPEVQLQVFQRSFSTKEGTGRGIGTYSVKLFGERYLKGTVGFTSREPDGTTFFISTPKHFA